MTPSGIGTVSVDPLLYVSRTYESPVVPVVVPESVEPVVEPVVVPVVEPVVVPVVEPVVVPVVEPVVVPESVEPEVFPLSVEPDVFPLVLPLQSQQWHVQPSEPLSMTNGRSMCIFPSDPR